jgi:nicotinate-nucleotide adenylyltransferase
MTEAVGIMGGTFDPIHFGHLVAAEEARVRFSLGRIVFVPNADPPHKKAYPVTPAERRHEMVVLATASNCHFEASRIELDRSGPSYSADTMRSFREQLGSQTKLYFITGVDAILEILNWHQPEQLAQLCEFIAVTRPGYQPQRLEAVLSRQFLARTHLLHIPGLAISSTELRQRAGAGESLRYLTPLPVVRYIAAHQLYQRQGAAQRAACGG